MDHLRQNMGHRFALHIILERLLVRLYAGDVEGLDELEAECVSAIDHMPADWFEGGNREVTEHLSDSVQAVFGGARSLLEGHD